MDIRTQHIRSNGRKKVPRMNKNRNLKLNNTYMRPYKDSM